MDGKPQKENRRAHFHTSELATFALYACILSNGSFTSYDLAMLCLLHFNF